MCTWRYLKPRLWCDEIFWSCAAASNPALPWFVNAHFSSPENLQCYTDCVGRRQSTRGECLLLKRAFDELKKNYNKPPPPSTPHNKADKQEVGENCSSSSGSFSLFEDNISEEVLQSLPTRVCTPSPPRLNSPVKSLQQQPTHTQVIHAASVMQAGLVKIKCCM